MAAAYRLNPQNVVGIDHALGYDALRSGQIDVKDAYSTDAKIAEYDLVVLEDDQKFFPRYDAVFLYRLSLNDKAVAVLRGLEGTIDEATMIAAQRRSRAHKRLRASRQFVFRSTARTSTSSFGESLCAQTLALDVAPSRTRRLLAAALDHRRRSAWDLGEPRRRDRPRHSRFCRRRADNSVARAARAARAASLFWDQRANRDRRLFLYGLLPIVRNTATGLQDIAQRSANPPSRSGSSSRARLWQIYLPMASRSILAGIKTSAVINIGTATLAALIGAGGLGEPILSGLNLNDHVTILQGAIPAAILALLVQWFFDLLDRVLIPKGLRL